MQTVTQRKPRSVKRNGVPSLDMSRAFQDKIRNRMRMHLCPVCGQPDGFCRRKSSMQHEKVGRVQIHNNKKLRRAWAEVKARERTYQEWDKVSDALHNILGKKLALEIDFVLHHHNVLPVLWQNVVAAITQYGANVEVIRFAWSK